MTLELAGSLESNTRNLVKVAKLTRPPSQISIFCLVGSLMNLIRVSFLWWVQSKRRSEAFRGYDLLVLGVLPSALKRIQSFQLQILPPGGLAHPPSHGLSLEWLDGLWWFGWDWISWSHVEVMELLKSVQISVEIWVSCSRFRTCATWRGYNANSFLARYFEVLFCRDPKRKLSNKRVFFHGPGPRLLPGARIGGANSWVIDLLRASCYGAGRCSLTISVNIA